MPDAPPAPAAYRVLSSKHYERDVRSLTKRNKPLLQIVKDLLVVLRGDPLNGTGVSKLTDVKQGDGQYRIRSGDYRIRYDVVGRDVVLHSFSHRKDAYS